MASLKENTILKQKGTERKNYVGKRDQKKNIKKTDTPKMEREKGIKEKEASLEDEEGKKEREKLRKEKIL